MEQQSLDVLIQKMEKMHSRVAPHLRLNADVIASSGNQFSNLIGLRLGIIENDLVGLFAAGAPVEETVAAQRSVPVLLARWQPL